MLNWPIGTLSGRLSRGRALLKGRLERPGLAVPMAAISRPFLNLSDPPAASLIASTLKSATLFAASQPVSPNVLSLTQGVLRTMLFQKIKIVSLALLVVGSVSGLAGASRCGRYRRQCTSRAAFGPMSPNRYLTDSSR